MLRHARLGLGLVILICVGCPDDDEKGENVLTGPICRDPLTVLDMAKGQAAEKPCRIDIDPHIPMFSAHFPIGTSKNYHTNPPTSGSHYPRWAAYKEYDTPVDRRYYVHNLEHGAIVFLYNCDLVGADECASIKVGLRKAREGMAEDPSCTDKGEGVRVRALITPDPKLDVPVAVAAWGWTYRAECLHIPSVSDFAKEHYSHGDECLCDNGITAFE